MFSDIRHPLPPPVQHPPYNPGAGPLPSCLTYTFRHPLRPPHRCGSRGLSASDAYPHHHTPVHAPCPALLPTRFRSMQTPSQASSGPPFYSEASGLLLFFHSRPALSHRPSTTHFLRVLPDAFGFAEAPAPEAEGTPVNLRGKIGGLPPPHFTSLLFTYAFVAATPYYTHCPIHYINCLALILLSTFQCMYLYPRLSRGYSRDNKLEFKKKKKG